VEKPPWSQIDVLGPLSANGEVTLAWSFLLLVLNLYFTSAEVPNQCPADTLKPHNGVLAQVGVPRGTSALFSMNSLTNTETGSEGSNPSPLTALQGHRALKEGDDAVGTPHRERGV
jgi:hypothetical protein